MLATEASDKLLDKATEIIGQLQALAPDVADAALRATQMQGRVELAIGVVFLVVSSAVGWCGVRIVRWVLTKTDEDPTDEPLFWAGAVMAIASVITAITGGLARLTDSTLWIAAFDPAAALALKVVG